MQMHLCKCVYANGGRKVFILNENVSMPASVVSEAPYGLSTVAMTLTVVAFTLVTMAFIVYDEDTPPDMPLR